jgi:hypothetical protein
MNTNEHSEPIPLLTWDTCEIAMDQAKYLLENGEVANEDRGFELACQDRDLLMFEWQWLTDTLTETLNAVNPDGYWQTEVTGFGWRGQEGYKDFEAYNGSDFLKNILPETDCRFKLFLDKSIIRIRNFYHDSPTGNEWYTIQPISEL